MYAVVDTGPLYAAVDADDEHHAASVRALRTPGLRLVIPTLVIAEATYLVGSRLGAKVEAAFLKGLESMDVEGPEPKEWLRISELVARYSDFPLGGTDASVLALAERFETDLIVTLDKRHFQAVRPRHCKALKLLP